MFEKKTETKKLKPSMQATSINFYDYMFYSLRKKGVPLNF